MSGFVKKETCAVPGCRRRIPIIYATAINPAMILAFCGKHVPKKKVIETVTVVKGKHKGKKFGVGLLYDEEGFAWIKKCKATIRAELNIDPGHYKASESV